MKRWLYKNVKWRFISIRNYRRGYAYGPVARCRVCGHTAYSPDHCARREEM